ncbi:MAG: hypothetical protein M3461_20800 [Pseudomonadota bacterium]|nr:hypothetical protein [Pseudomonadota bacterium]
MQPNDDKNLRRLVTGLSAPEQPQPKAGKDGDPQLAALCQRILGAMMTGTRKALVDFGSGNGVLPHQMVKFAAQSEYPCYWAVDFPSPLDDLAIPHQLHNGSRKYTVDDFYDKALKLHADQIGIVVLRNILHEMTIADTTRLFSALRAHLPDDASIYDASIYIQDMARLATPERGNVGWDLDLLEGCLGDLGFKVISFPQVSYGGVPWFAMDLRVIDRTERNDHQRLCAARSEQLDRIAVKLSEAGDDYTRTSELMLLQHEYTTLALQLRKAGWSDGARHRRAPALGSLSIPLHPFASDLDYACQTPEASSVSGLVAMLSSKRLIDFPRLIATATRDICFGGYSNRLLFVRDENRAALRQALSRCVAVRVVVADPRSCAAALRSQEPVYANPGELLGAIGETIERGRDFAHRIAADLGDDVRGRLTIRASGHVPRWSYCIVDDWCYLSFYSGWATGSASPCLVFRGLPHAVQNYFHVVRQEFLSIYHDAQDLLGLP